MNEEVNKGNKGKEEMYTTYPTHEQSTFRRRVDKEGEIAKELGCKVVDNGDHVKIVYPTNFKGTNIEILIILYGRYPFHAPYVHISNLIHPNIYPIDNVNTKMWSKNIDRELWKHQIKISKPGRLMYSNIIDYWSPAFQISNLLQDILSVLNDPEYEHVLNLNAE
jgi:ubiquitin-protein ligase